MDYKIRLIKKSEYTLLNKFLYEAIFIEDNQTPPPFNIIEKPDLQVYVKDFGKANDDALIAEVNGEVVGIVWSRIMNDYGHIDDSTPSLAISIYKEYRGNGIGTNLMSEILNHLKNKGYKKVSLSVQKKNYAFKMYCKLGFKIIKETEDEYIMENVF